MAKTIQIYKSIKLLRERYLKVSQHKASLLQLISETEISEQVYNSNAIENSTLTLEETDKILMQIELDRFISERELFETKKLSKNCDVYQHNCKEKTVGF